MPPADVAATLTEAFQGEVLGEAFFALLAECEDDAARLAEWRRLEHVERLVKERLAEALVARGLPAEEDPAKREQGRALARGLAGLEPARRRGLIASSLERGAEATRATVTSLPAELFELGAFYLAHAQALLDAFRAGSGGAAGDDPVVCFLAGTGAPEPVPVPEGLQLIPQNERYREDPAAVHAELQRRAPVHRDRQLGGLIVSGHDAVRRIVYDLSWWVDPRKARAGDPVRQFLPEDDGREPSMLFLDDPEHKRLRNLVSRSFTPRAVRELEPVVARVARELVDAIERAGEPEVDLIDALAAPLPAIAIARILGVDPARQASFKAWSVASSEAFFNPFAGEEVKRAGEAAQAALDGVFREEIDRRREAPVDDLIGRLVAAERAGDRLSESELVTLCNLLLIAGNVTTTDLIGNGVHALLGHPAEHAKLRARPELLPNAVEEMLRFDPPVQVTGRIAPRDGDIDGVPIRAGESVNVLLAAANRDPAVYPEPDRFDIERADVHHHSFGGGAHLCLGAHLARAEARAAIGELVARFPRLRASGGPLAWKQTPGFRGLAEYRVRID